MKRLICILAFTIACLISRDARSAAKPITLALEDWTTLHVGEVAVLHIPSDMPYKLNGFGDVITLVKQSGLDVTFRAVRPGTTPIILSPANRPDGECISCVTVHYFVKVVPRK